MTKYMELHWHLFRRHDDTQQRFILYFCEQMHTRNSIHACLYDSASIHNREFCCIFVHWQMCILQRFPLFVVWLFRLVIRVTPIRCLEFVIHICCDFSRIPCPLSELANSYWNKQWLTLTLPACRYKSSTCWTSKEMLVPSGCARNCFAMATCQCMGRYEIDWNTFMIS